MAAWYNSGLAIELPGSDPLTVQPVTQAFVFDATHDTLDDVDAGEFLGDAIALSSVTFTAGLLDADADTLTSIGLGDIIGGLLFYLDSGTPSTSPLVLLETKKADNTTLAFTGTGNPLSVDWPAGIGSR